MYVYIENWKDVFLALAGGAQWTEYRPEKPGVTGLIPVRAHAWVAGQVPSGGHAKRQPHIDVSLPLFLHPFPSEKK